MKPVFQSRVVEKADGEFVAHGNCWEACIASILELPLSAVPDIGGDPQWWLTMHTWLRDAHGLTCWPLEATLRAGDPDYVWPIAPGHYVGIGQSPRGDWKHAVVMCNGVVAHDPYPDGAALRIEEIETIEVLVRAPTKVAT